MNFDELKGAELDYWTARAEGLIAELRMMYGQSYCRIDVVPAGYSIYEPTKNSQLAADIAFRCKYTLYPHPCLNEAGVQKTIWLAEAQMNRRYHGMFTDESPQVAICRLRVAEKFAIGELEIGAAAARLPDHVYEARALRFMTDVQAEQSYFRWRAHSTNHSENFHHI